MRQGESPLDVRHRPRRASRPTRIPIFYVQMAHARLSGIFRTAGSRRRPRRGRSGPRGAARRRRTPSCSRSWSAFPRWWRRRRASGSRTASPSTSRSWPGASTAGITTRARSARQAPDDRAGPAAPGPRRAHHPGQRTHAARPFRPRPDVTDEPARRRQRRARLDLHAVRRDGRRARRLRRLLQRRRLDASSGAGGRRRRPTTIRWPSSSGWPRAASTGPGVEQRRGRELPLEGQVFLRPAEPRDAGDPARRLRRFPAQASAEVSRERSSCSSATSTPSSSSACSTRCRVRSWWCATP